MALAYRVNINISPLLSTFYCKCIVNISRFKSEYNLQKQTNHGHDEESIKDYKTFEQMITFRQNQARRSILVRINSIDSMNEVERFCLRYSKVVHMFPYSTINEKNFLLMEFDCKQHVESFRELATYKLDLDCVQTVSPLFLYKCSNYLDRNKAMSKIKTISPYSSFIAPSTNAIREQLKSLETVSEQMISLYDILKVTDLNARLRFYTAEQLSYYLSRLFSNVTVVPFGSSVNGFGQLGCDLDLLCKTTVCNESESQWKKFLYLAQPIYLSNRHEQKEFLESVGVIMKTCIPGINNVRKILEARVPIIKFFNTNTNMQCDLSSTNMIALHMSELLYMYGQLDWRVKPLVCTIRKWARCRGVTKDTSGHWITNFSLTLLIIFYLQTRSIIPSLNAVKYYAELTKKSNKLSNSNLSWFLKWKESIKYNNDENLHNLLFGFFEYYSMFDFKMQAVCIREARLKMKKDVSPLYIYNPFDLTLNVSKNITALELSRIIDNFRSALQILLDSNEHNMILRLLNVKQPHFTIRRDVPHSKVKKPVDQNNDDKNSNYGNEEVNASETEKLIEKDLIVNKTVTKTEEKVEENIIK